MFIDSDYYSGDYLHRHSLDCDDSARGFGFDDVRRGPDGAADLAGGATVVTDCYASSVDYFNDGCHRVIGGGSLLLRDRRRRTGLIHGCNGHGFSSNDDVCFVGIHGHCHIFDCGGDYRRHRHSGADCCHTNCYFLDYSIGMTCVKTHQEHSGRACFQVEPKYCHPVEHGPLHFGHLF